MIENERKFSLDYSKRVLWEAHGFNNDNRENISSNDERTAVENYL